MSYENHEIAEQFPHMTPEELADLAKDIVKNGLLMPIILYEGKVLDGRHRNRACDLAGVPPRYEEFTGSDPVAFVISVNERRRHMTTSQRAMVAAGLANLPVGKPPKGNSAKRQNFFSSIASLTVAALANKLQVSKRNVARAKKVKAADPALAAQVTAGTVTVGAAEKKVDAAAAAPAAPAPGAKAAPAPVVLDNTKFPVPADKQPMWARRNEVLAKIKLVSGLQNDLLELQKTKDPLFGPINFSEASLLLSQVRGVLREAELFCVCPYCNGHESQHCTPCKTRGFFTRQHWKMVPSEIRAFRAAPEGEGEAA